MEERSVFQNSASSHKNSNGERKDNTYNTEPGEQRGKEVVHKLNNQGNLSQQRVVGSENVVPVTQSMQTSKEGTVEPSTTLGDKFGDRIGD
jgi:hypothetical protein